MARWLRALLITALLTLSASPALSEEGGEEGGEGNNEGGGGEGNNEGGGEGSNEGGGGEGNSEGGGDGDANANAPPPGAADATPVVITFDSGKLYAGVAGSTAPAATLDFALTGGGYGDVNALKGTLQSAYEDLGVATNAQPLLLSFTHATPAAQREQLATVAFNDLGVPSLFMAPDVTFATYASGRPTGLSVVAQPDGFYIAAVFDGYSLSVSYMKASASNLHEQIYDAIAKCDVGIRPDLSKNIILAGEGTSAINRDALMAELVGMIPPAWGVKFAPIQETAHTVWLGASVLGNDTSYRKLFISREDFQKEGPSVVTKRAF